MEIKNNVDAPECQPGDEVFWTIRPRGKERTIRCEIVEIITPGHAPGKDKYPGLYHKGHPKTPREHYSYLISEGDEVDIHHRYHWPRLSELSKVDVKLEKLMNTPSVLEQTNPHRGSTLDSFLQEEGIKDEVMQDAFAEMAKDPEAMANVRELDPMGDKTVAELMADLHALNSDATSDVSRQMAPEPEPNAVETFVSGSVSTVTKVVSGLVREFISLLVKELPRGTHEHSGLQEAFEQLKENYNKLREEREDLFKSWQLAALENKEHVEKLEQEFTRERDTDHKRHLLNLAEKDAELASKDKDLAMVRGYMEEAVNTVEKLTKDAQEKAEGNLWDENARLKQELEEARSRAAFYQEKAKPKRKKDSDATPFELVRFVLHKHESAWSGFDVKGYQVGGPRERVVEEYLAEFNEQHGKVSAGDGHDSGNYSNLDGGRV